jgi:F-type H+-transporting ATPase subunit epsilon
MSLPLQLEVITAADTVLKAEVRDVYVPAFLGEAGVLENHLPYLSLLNAGEVSYLGADDRRHYLYIRSGFLEVRGNKVAIVAESVVEPDGMDLADLQAQLQKSEARVKSAGRGEITAEELDAELRRTADLRCQLDVARKAGRS